jgi:hypothetical protein
MKIGMLLIVFVNLAFLRQAGAVEIGQCVSFTSSNIPSGNGQGLVTGYATGYGGGPVLNVATLSPAGKLITVAVRESSCKVLSSAQAREKNLQLALATVKTLSKDAPGYADDVIINSDSVRGVNGTRTQ